MPKPVTATEIADRAAAIRLENLLGMRTVRKVGDRWAKGDAAWVRDGDGDYFFGVLLENPVPTVAGPTVMVQSDEGTWEVPLRQLRTSKPRNAPVYVPRGAVASARRPATEPTRKATAATANACCCGCGAKTAPGRRFVQGHDSKFHSRIRRLERGEMGLADIVRELGPAAVMIYKEYTK